MSVSRKNRPWYNWTVLYYVCCLFIHIILLKRYIAMHRDFISAMAYEIDEASYFTYQFCLFKLRTKMSQKLRIIGLGWRENAITVTS